MTAPPLLPPCPAKPSCVSTEATDPSRRMDPIPFTGSPEEALERLAAVLGGLPGGRVVAREGDRLRAEVRSRILGLVDDVEMVVDRQAEVVRFRSRSRKGYWDLGVNRRRMEKVRAAFLGE